jgi:hypothetical protein
MFDRTSIMRCVALAVIGYVASSDKARADEFFCTSPEGWPGEYYCTNPQCNMSQPYYTWTQYECVYGGSHGEYDWEYQGSQSSNDIFEFEYYCGLPEAP